MTWVRRAATDPHRCAPPMRESVHQLPSMSILRGGQPTEVRLTSPDGQVGDLWRCPCRALWRISYGCDTCDRAGRWSAHGGHAMGAIWRPATLWQRIRYRRGKT